MIFKGVHTAGVVHVWGVAELSVGVYTYMCRGIGSLAQQSDGQEPDERGSTQRKEKGRNTEGEEAKGKRKHVQTVDSRLSSAMHGLTSLRLGPRIATTARLPMPRLVQLDLERDLRPLALRVQSLVAMPACG